MKTFLVLMFLSISLYACSYFIIYLNNLFHDNLQKDIEARKRLIEDMKRAR